MDGRMIFETNFVQLIPWNVYPIHVLQYTHIRNVKHEKLNPLLYTRKMPIECLDVSDEKGYKLKGFIYLWRKEQSAVEQKITQTQGDNQMLQGRNIATGS